MKFIAFYSYATAGVLRPVSRGDVTGWPWHDFAVSLGGDSLGMTRTILPYLGKSAFVHALACCGGLVQVKSLRVSTRSTFCFYSKYVLFLLEVRSASTRITFCFDSNHVLLRLESRSVSTRITFCFHSNHSTCSLFTLHLQVCVALPEQLGRSMAAAPGHGPRTDHDERENTDSCASL